MSQSLADNIKPRPLPTNLMATTVLSTHHWTDRLFSFTTERDPSFRFENGQFAMLGLLVDGKPLLRAYSMASANYEDRLEFFSIKVPEGPLTSRLQRIVPGDTVLVGRKATGTLLLDNLRPGKRLYMLSTGTGLAPFLSLTKCPRVYENFEQVILTHTCRTIGELAYADRFRHELPDHEFLGELIAGKLIYYPTCTREDFAVTGRITQLIESGRLAADCMLPDLDPSSDRVMICGSEPMLAETQELLKHRGFVEGNSAEPGDYVVEKAFADK